MHRQVDVTIPEILGGYDALADLYSHVPPLMMWRAWEYALYRRYRLPGPVLDIGCGDGQFFRRVFPDAVDVVGVDHSDAAVEAARHSGLYRAVYHAPAHRLPMADASFASAFANCSLEHMDHLDRVLAEVHRVTQPGGSFLFSVVTEAFVRWAPLAELLTVCGAGDAGRAAQAHHEAYHHLVNAFPVPDWIARVELAGFRVREWAPLVAGTAGRVFLLLDQLWHVPAPPGELGDRLAGELAAREARAPALRKVFEGLLDLGLDGPPAGLSAARRTKCPSSAVPDEKRNQHL